jgi:hypothetical protein
MWTIVSESDNGEEAPSSASSTPVEKHAGEVSNYTNKPIKEDHNNNQKQINELGKGCNSVESSFSYLFSIFSSHYYLDTIMLL